MKTKARNPATIVEESGIGRGEMARSTTEMTSVTARTVNASAGSSSKLPIIHRPT